MVQLDEARKQLDARQKTRTREGNKLRTALSNLEAQAAADAQQVVSAQQAHEELLKNLPSYLSPASQHSPHPPSLAPKCHVGSPAPADAVQQPPALGALAPHHQPPSLSARPHLKKYVPKLLPSHMAPQVMAPHLQGVSSAASQGALRAAPMSMAPNARSASARKILPMQQAAWHPTPLQQASAQVRHAHMASEQSAQLAVLPQDTYSAKRLAAASAQASALTLQQRQAAACEGPQLQRSKLSSPSRRVGCLSGLAAVTSVKNAPMKKRAEAMAGIKKHMLLPAGPETLKEGLTTELMGSMTQQGGFNTQHVGSMSQQRGRMTQQVGSMTQQEGRVTQQMGSKTQQRGWTAQQVGSMTQQMGSVTQQRGSTIQQMGSMTQQPAKHFLPWARTATAVHQPHNPAVPSAATPAQAAPPHPAATITTYTAQPCLVLPSAAAWTGTPVPAAQFGQASPGCHKAPVPMQAKPLQSQQCQPQAVPKSATLASPCPPAAALTAAATGSVLAPLLMPCAGSLSNQSPACLLATASAASGPAAPCLAGPGTASLQAIASQQQLVSAQAASGQAFTTQEVSHHLKAPPQTYHLQAPACSLTAASASDTTPVPAACGLSSTVHPDVADSPGCQMPPQHIEAQGLAAQSSAAQRVAAVSSAGGTASAQASRVQSYVNQGSGAQGSCPQPPVQQILSSSRAHARQSVHSSCTSNRAATPKTQESRTERIPTACISPQLLAPAALGLPAELLALFSQSAACTPHASSSPVPCSAPAYVFPTMQLPVKSASWQTGGSNQSIMPDDTHCDDVHSQEHANIMLDGMY